MQTLCALPESQSETVAGWRGCLVRDAGPDGFANPLFGSPGVLEETTASEGPSHAGHARPARPRHNRRSASTGHSEPFGTSGGSSLRVFCTLRCAPGDPYCQRFGYDNEDRLTEFHRQNGDSQTWNLSLVGDWNQFNANGTIQNRTHNAVHELIKVNNEALLYDAKGNLTENDNEQRYEWDIENRMTVAVLTSDKPRDRAIILGEYAYDALGRRVSKRVGDVETIFINDGLQEIAEYEKTGKKSVLEKAFVFGSYIDEPLVMIHGKDKFYYHTNNLYSVAALTNQAGATVERYTYDPYGKVKILAPNGVRVLAESSVGNPWTYTGRRLDAETGLMYYRARYYDAGLGRFIGRDPIESIENWLNVGVFAAALKSQKYVASQNGMNRYFATGFGRSLRKYQAEYQQKQKKTLADLRNAINLYEYVKSKSTIYIDPLGLDCFSDYDTCMGNAEVTYNACENAGVVICLAISSHPYCGGRSTIISTVVYNACMAGIDAGCQAGRDNQEARCLQTLNGCLAAIAPGSANQPNMVPLGGGFYYSGNPFTGGR